MSADPTGNGAQPILEDPFGLCGETIAGKYRIQSVEGRGGFGVVYRGVHDGFDEAIAVKCLRLPRLTESGERESLLKRLKDEGRVLHRLSRLSNHIVQALDVGAVESPSGHWVPYLVLEWLNGKTLSRYLAEREQTLSVQEAFRVLSPAAEALDIAHQQKVAHRDIKPDNIFISEVNGQETLKVLDFGIAKVLSQHATFSAAAAATHAATSVFTPAYGAPEQFNKKRGATGPWTDVFALALLFVEAVSGRRALDGDDPTQLYIAAADPASRPTLLGKGIDTNEHVDDVLQLALSVDPAERFQTAGAFWRALEAAVQDEQGPSTATQLSGSSAQLDTGEFLHNQDMALNLPGAPGTAAKPTKEPAGDLASAQSNKATTIARPQPSSEHAAEAQAAALESHATGHANTVDATDNPLQQSRRNPGSRWVPAVVVLALGGAALLYKQLRAIAPPVVNPMRSAATGSRATRPDPSIDTTAGTASPTASAQATAIPETSSSAVASASASSATRATVTPTASAGASTSVQAAAPPGMLHLRPTAQGAPWPFYIDRSEVTVGAYQECVMAGRCKNATRIVLTPAGAKAIGALPEQSDGTSLEQLATAWSGRCNAKRGQLRQPVNCVNHGSAADYCLWRGKRLPTRAEWLAAASPKPNTRFVWGDGTPSCNDACFGRNSRCLDSQSKIASCQVGQHLRDRTSGGVFDMAANLSEWVSDTTAKRTGGPAWHRVLGGNFLDEPPALHVTAERQAPPVTAHVTVGFRCAKSAPRPTTPPPSAAPKESKSPPAPPKSTGTVFE